jgi:hypothetical protein
MSKILPKRMCSAYGCRTWFRPKHANHWFCSGKCRTTDYRDRLLGFRPVRHDGYDPNAFLPPGAA